MRNVDPEAILSVWVRDQTYDLTTSDLALLVAEPPLRECDNCGGTDLTWHLGKHFASGVDPHRMSGHDVIPILYQACEECGDVLRTIEDDAELARLLNAGK